MQYISGKKGKKQMNLSISEFLYYAFFSTMLIAKGIGLYEGMRSYKLCLLASAVFILLKFFIDKYSVYEYIFIGSFIFLGVLIYWNSGEQAALIYIVMVMGLKNVPIKRVFKLGAFLWTTCFAARGILGMSGVSRGLVLVHDKLGLGPIIRWSFSYPHPNVLHISYTVFAAFILYSLDLKSKNLLKCIIFLFIGNCLTFLYSISFTGFLLTSFFLFLYLFLSTRNTITKWERLIIQAILPFCICFSVILPVAMEKGCILNSLDDVMNKVFNTRFLASRVYMYEGLSLFGKDFSNTGITFALDCSYVNLLVRGGLILFLLTMTGYFFTIKNLLSQDRKRDLAIVLSFLVAGISEPFLFNTSFKNLSLLYVGEYFYNISKIYIQENKCRFFTKEIGFFSIGSTNIPLLNYSVKRNFIKVFRLMKKNSKVFYFMGIVGGVLGMIIYFYNIDVPQSIYVASGNTDCGKREEYYISGDIVSSDLNSLYYEYGGENTPMYKFTGNLILFEEVRNAVSSLILGSLLGIVVSMCLFVMIVIIRKQ